MKFGANNWRVEIARVSIVVHRTENLQDDILCSSSINTIIAPRIGSRIKTQLAKEETIQFMENKLQIELIQDSA
jgi:hypothetical protein